MKVFTGPFLLVVLLTMLAIQCAARLDRLDGTAWGTSWSLVVESNVSGDPRKIVEDVLNEYGSVLSTYRDDSEIARLNRLPPGMSLTISPRMQKALELATDLCRRTDGVFDPLLGDPMRHYGFEPDLSPHPGQGGRGQPQSLGLRGRHCEAFELSGDRFTRRISDTLNLNAIAEGLAMDEIAEALNSSGRRQFLFELGGEAIAGLPPSQRPQGWWVGIESPRESEARLLSISIRNAALSTSGTYRNVRGSFSHLIDSRTMRPLPASPISASAFCSHAAVADGLATTLAIAGVEKATVIMRRFPGCEALIQQDGSVWYSPGWPGEAGR